MKSFRAKPIPWPRLTMPRLLDQDDARILGRIVVYSILFVWAIIVLAVALGFGARLFLLAKGG